VTNRDRKRLIVALMVAPLVIALPMLGAYRGQPGFVVRNLDQLLIFVAMPYAVAAWLYLRPAKHR
jgi:hypothetical protein